MVVCIYSHWTSISFLCLVACSSDTRSSMSGKYVFTKALKELRFQHCQTSDHSNAVRYVDPSRTEEPMHTYTNQGCLLDHSSRVRTPR